jgi:2-keto-4-pentenoate hydratase/2-oxohepta-3-ene-1,7-dioic acid hydratase in catechol pathway
VRLLTYEKGGKVAVGIRGPDGIAPSGYDDMVRLIEDGASGLERAYAAAESAAGAGQLVEPDRVLAPIPRPRVMLYMGINFKSHGDELSAGMPAPPSIPLFFSKLPSAVIGPGEPIVIPTPETQADYEVELACVIGRTAKKVEAGDAHSYVFGWTVAHDVSARDVQMTENQLTLGKGPDTFAPLGPEIVTADEIRDPAGLQLATFLNGERMQWASTSDLIWTFDQLIEYASAYVTLEPGDIVTSGTPGGIGYFRDPQRWLMPGDEVTVEVEGIGRLTNPVAAGWGRA